MDTPPPYNEQTVKEVIRLCSFGLVKGLGEPVEGKMCIEAVIAKAHGLPHQDKNPECVGKEVAKCKIGLNDCNWSSNEARSKGMIAIGIAQLGSNVLDQNVFRLKLHLNSDKRILAFLIQEHYDSLKIKDKKLLEFKIKFENLVELNHELWKEFYHYYDNNCYYNYYNSYNYNSFDFNHSCYNYDYHYYNCYDLGDAILLLIADVILQTLKEMKSPGCEYLYLIEENELKKTLS